MGNEKPMVIVEAKEEKIVDSDDIRNTSFFGSFYNTMFPWQYYKHPAAGKIIEQDFTYVDNYPSSFTPWTDLFAAFGYGLGITPFATGLLDGAFESKEAENRIRAYVSDVKNRYPTGKSVEDFMKEQIGRELDAKLKWSKKRLGYKDAATGKEGYIEVIPALGSPWVNYNVGGGIRGGHGIEDEITLLPGTDPEKYIKFLEKFSEIRDKYPESVKTAVALSYKENIVDPLLKLIDLANKTLENVYKIYESSGR